MSLLRSSKVKKIKAPATYQSFFLDLKARIARSQLDAILKVNAELIGIYWFIGKSITERQSEQTWGKNIVERLAKDLKKAFPGVEGFSRSNLFRMRSFYKAFRDFDENTGNDPNLPPFFCLNIPWWHNVLLVERLDDLDKRIWYAQQCIEHGWSSNTLVHWIESDLYKRKGKAISNFQNTLPQPQSDLAQQQLKDPYIFGYLELSQSAREKEIEKGLVEHIQKFLQELGQGFAFVGRQYSLDIGGRAYYIDLLFYHLQLRCFIVVELKTGEFDVRDAGQMNFYLSAVDDQLRHKDDQPSIGIILCKTKEKIAVEYALRNVNNPIGVASYMTKLVASLPKKLRGSLPSVKEIENEMLGTNPKLKAIFEEVTKKYKDDLQKLSKS